MSVAAEKDETIEEPEPMPRVLAVEIGGWPGLGGQVRVPLGGARTVLVGKNAAGKSLLMEGIHALALHALAPQAFLDGSRFQFRAEIETASRSLIVYEYRSEAEEPADKAFAIVKPARLRPARRWEEQCWQDGHEIWHIKDGGFTSEAGGSLPFAPGTGLLAQGPGPIGGSVDSIVVSTGLSRVFSGLRLIHAGVPRIRARREILVRTRSGSAEQDRDEAMARSLAFLYELEPESYDAFVATLRKIGLVEEMEVEIYKSPGHASGSDEVMSFLLDGVNIGFLSDGTLRVCEIVLGLLDESTSVLLIEEPETAVHPGLLHKLLALIDTYSIDRQIVISTHSPIVVDWCRPTELRLVERSKGVTSVRAFSTEEVRGIEAYLEDRGTFADYVYSQADE